MSLYTTLASLSQTAASNVADGSTDAPSTVDQQTNLLASFIARARDGDLATAIPTVASAATLALDGTASGTAYISGTTTVTAVTLAEGSRKTLRFSGALTLTNGANLVLPGSANITTAAGDYATFVGRSGGVVECIAYEVASLNPKPAFSLGTNGYMKFPNGIVVQWGTTAATTISSSAISVTFPIAFPNAAWTAVVSNGDTGATLSTPGIGSGTLSTTGMSAVFTTGTGGVGGGVNVRVNWVAFGN